MIVHIKKLYVCISWYFFIMVLWVILNNKIESFLLCISALILHELGHIVMICILKEKINIFYILPFGFCCKLKNQNKIANRSMIKILLAGPVTSILAAGLFLLWTNEFTLVNFMVGIFNLLPFGDLDGGRIVKIMVHKKAGDR